MTARIFQRILLEQLADYETLGWTVALHVPTDAAIIDPVSGGTRLTCLVMRDEDRDQAPGPNLRTLDDQHLIEDLIKALAAPGDHGLMLRLDLLQALVRLAFLRGDHERARVLIMARLELARTNDRAGQGG